MLKLRGCPKCQGALQLASDMYGRYVNCLQCGFARDLPEARVEPVEGAVARREYRVPERKAA